MSILTALQNKWENVSERALDILIDHLNTLNDLTPKIKAEGREGVDPNLIFGIDSKLFGKEGEGQLENHHDEVETLTIYKGAGSTPHSHTHDESTHRGDGHHSDIAKTPITSAEPLNEEVLKDALSKVSKESVWRVKGFVRTEKGVQILNWAFGRYELTGVEQLEGFSDLDVVKLTVMGERGEVKRAGRRLAEALGGSL